MKNEAALRLTKLAARAADEKMGTEIMALDVSRESTLADYFVFITGTSHVHVRALEDTIRENLRNSGGSLSRTDGQRGHLWRVLDYGSLIIHIMDSKTRAFYSIEKLWERGRPVKWESVTKVVPVKAAKSAKAAAARKAKKKSAAKKKKTARR